MRSVSIRRKPDQLNLFHPPRVMLQWDQLPPEIRQQSVVLLAHLLRAFALLPTEAKVAGDGDE